MLGQSSATVGTSFRPGKHRPVVIWAGLLAGVVGLTLLAVVASGGAGGTTAGTATGQDDTLGNQTGIDEGPFVQVAPTAACELSDDEAPPGSSVSILAFDSQNAEEFRYDKQGDGTWDTDWITSGSQSFPYEQTGTYEPRVQVRSSDGLTDTATCPTLTIDENEDPNPQLTYSPSSPDVGEQITFDPSGTSDPDGDDIFLYEYDWTDDGTYDELRETNETVTNTYSTRGEKTVRLRVQDEHEATATTTVTFFVGRREPSAECSVDKQTVAVGEQVQIDASGSTNADTADFNVDNDETFEYTNQTDLSTTHRYETPGSYEVTTVVRNGELTDRAFCGTVDVTENEPPTARLSVDPIQATVGESVTFDASNSTDPDGSIRAYWWDFDNDNTVDRYTNVSATTYPYQSSGSYNPVVTVVDDDGAQAQATRDVVVDAPAAPTTRCSIEETTVTVGESTVVDASASDGVNTVEFNTDEDGTFERNDSDDFVIRVSYETPGEYTVVARGTNEGGSDIEECGTITVRDPGTEVPRTTPRTFTDEFRTTTFPDREYRSPSDAPGTDEDPSGDGDETTTEKDEDPGGLIPNWVPPLIGGLLGLAGLGGAAYYIYPGGGGGGGTSAPPKPPSVPPSSTAAQYETGTFLTPPESGPVTVSGLGFEPDLLTFAVTTNVRASESGSADRSDGWSHGRAIRGTEGTIPQTAVSLTDDTRSFDAAMGASSDGHAIEIDLHEDAPPERITGQVTTLTEDGFEMTFDVTGLHGDRAGDQYVVHYQAFAFGKDSRVEVGHFRTPEFPGTQSIPLNIDADHVVLTATNTLGNVDDRRMTDLPIGFSHGEVVGRQSPGQLVRNTTVAPAGPGATAQAAYEGRALHLLYADDEEIRGRTTATVTSLGDSIDLEYEKVYSGPSKLGSVESKLVTYVALETGSLQPVIGYFQLPAEDDVLHVDVGFEPRMIEFTTLDLPGIDSEQFSCESPLGFGWSHGTALGGREGMDGVRQYVLNDGIVPDRSTYEPHAEPRHDGVAAAVRSLADGGRVVGRDELTVTDVTDAGFQVAVTGLNAGDRDDGTRPYVFYKAWPNPDTASEGPAGGRGQRQGEASTGGRGGDRDRRERGRGDAGAQGGRAGGGQHDTGQDGPRDGSSDRNR